jgi:phosphatidylinositol-3,4,5-trisphosphate 3-phosphatase/dual-specificity protein phosphatase PTEN
VSQAVITAEVPDDDDDDDDDDDEDDTPKRKGSLSMRSLVSKKKVRYIQDGFNLDLTYITPNVIAMGFPSEGLEGMYRNKMTDVQAFMAKYHPGKHRVYNLCSEREYPASKFEQCVHFPFDDHNPPPFRVLIAFCQDVAAFLQKDPENVVAVHCKAGKGRTGTCIAAYFVYAGMGTAQEALDLFGRKRTSNSKGVTIPSQRRWVHHFEQMLREFYWRGVGFPDEDRVATLVGFELAPRIDYDVTGGCDPYLVIRSMATGKKDIYNSRKDKQAKATHQHWDGDTPYGASVRVDLQGEVQLTVMDYDSVGKDDKMFSVWLQTSFITGSKVTLTKAQLDGAVKDKACAHFPADFVCTLYFDNSVAWPSGIRVGEEDTSSEANRACTGEGLYLASPILSSEQKIVRDPIPE